MPPSLMRPRIPRPIWLAACGGGHERFSPKGPGLAHYLAGAVPGLLAAHGNMRPDAPPGLFGRGARRPLAPVILQPAAKSSASRSQSGFRPLSRLANSAWCSCIQWPSVECRGASSRAAMNLCCSRSLGGISGRARSSARPGDTRPCGGAPRPRGRGRFRDCDLLRQFPNELHSPFVPTPRGPAGSPAFAADLLTTCAEWSAERGSLRRFLSGSVASPDLVRNSKPR